MSEMIHQETMPEMEGAIVKRGHDEILELSSSLLEEFGLPLGLLPLADVTEIGFVRETGYFWVRQEKRIEHYFKKVGKLVSYETEITGYIQHNSIKNLTGVCAKMLLWLSIYEITVDESSAEKIHFKGLGGISRTFPVEAFAVGTANHATGIRHLKAEFGNTDLEIHRHPDNINLMLRRAETLTKFVRFMDAKDELNAAAAGDFLNSEIQRKICSFAPRYSIVVLIGITLFCFSYSPYKGYLF